MLLLFDFGGLRDWDLRKSFLYFYLVLCPNKTLLNIIN